MTTEKERIGGDKMTKVVLEKNFHGGRGDKDYGRRREGARRKGGEMRVPEVY